MKVYYKQRYGISAVMYLGLVGLTSIRPGDKFDKQLGYAIAMVKAHGQLNKRDAQLLAKIEKVPWKASNVPEESVGAIVVTALQYRQALGQVKFMVEDKWDKDMPPDYESPEHYPKEHLKGCKLVAVSKDGKGQPVCQVAEGFGRRLVKLGVL